MISLELLKDALGIDADDTSADDELVRLEAAAVAFLSNETGLYLGPVGEQVEYINGDGTRFIDISQYVAVSIES